jgi:hypothetical protein
VKNVLNIGLTDLTEKIVFFCLTIFVFFVICATLLPEWRNGRREGFKIPSWRQGVGSSPTSGIKPSYFDVVGVYFCAVGKAFSIDGVCNVGRIEGLL